MNWYILINTMPGNSETVGTAISSHKSLEAAYRAADRAQPSKKHNPGSYLPTVVRLSETRLERGSYVPQSAPQPDAEEAERVWTDYVYARVGGAR
jgi:hypothetical protein